MPISVTAIGAQGNMDTSHIPSGHAIDDRLMQAQAEVIRSMEKGGAYTGPIDEDRLMQAMQHSGPTPAEWAQQEVSNKQAIQDSATAYWDQRGKKAKDQWLSEPKIVEAEETTLGDVVNGTATSESGSLDLFTQETSLAVSNSGFRSLGLGAPFAEHEPKSEPMGFMEAMKPGSIKDAYSNIMVDLRRWDELPQATSLQKFQKCFLSAERIGAIVCSCILMVTLITFVVILTL